MEDSREVAKHMVAMLESSAQKRLTGVMLGMVVKLKYPDFKPLEYGCTNLKHFVESHASDRIQIVGKAGLDVVYALREAVGTGDETTAVDIGGDRVRHPTEWDETRNPERGASVSKPGGVSYSFPPDIWMAFASASPSGSVFVKESTGEFKAAKPDDAASLRGAGWSQIQSLTRDDHIQMARDFVAPLPSNVREAVASLIGLPGRWWLQFHQKLLTTSPEHAGKWKAFHNMRTQQKLVGALQKHGVPLEKIGAGYVREGTTASASEPASFDRNRLRYRADQTRGPDATLRSVSGLLTALGKLLEDLSG